jgi:hypothetical protein
MGWEIRANLGGHARTGVDASGWMWEITRDDEVVRVLIEISGTAWSTDPLRLPDDTRHAIETDGRTELLKVLAQNNPPGIIHCGSAGCAHSPAEDVR